MNVLGSIVLRLTTRLSISARVPICYAGLHSTMSAYKQKQKRNTASWQKPAARDTILALMFSTTPNVEDKPINFWRLDRKRASISVSIALS